MKGIKWSLFYLFYFLVCIQGYSWLGDVFGIDFGTEYTNRGNDDLEQLIKTLPYKVIIKGGKPFINVNYKGESKYYSPEEIAAMIIKKMKEIAEKRIGREIEYGLLAAPADEKDQNKQLLKDAGSLAGLEILRIINEPHGVATGYFLDACPAMDTNFLIFNIGGTFSVDVMTSEKGFYETISSYSDFYFGGRLLNERIMEYLLQQWKSKAGNDASNKKYAISKLEEEVEKGKRILSSELEYKFEIDHFQNEQKLLEVMKREKFEELISDLINKIRSPITQVLQDAKLKKEDIHEIILNGGNSNIPIIQQIIKDYFNRKETITLNPEELIVRGAAYVAKELTKEEETDDITGDIIGVSLGIETAGGIMTNFLKSSSFYPFQVSRNFSTFEDNQESVIIRLFVGDRIMVRDNLFVGEIELLGISPAPRGIPTIEVTVGVDVNGGFHIRVEDIQSVNYETVRYNYYRLTEEVIYERREEAARMEGKDRKIKEEAQMIHPLDVFLISKDAIERNEKERREKDEL